MSKIIKKSIDENVKITTKDDCIFEGKLLDVDDNVLVLDCDEIVFGDIIISLNEIKYIEQIAEKIKLKEE